MWEEVDDDNNGEIDENEITNLLWKAYLQSETDGILQIAAPAIKQFEFEDKYKCKPIGYELTISSALDAVYNSKGQAAVILNALIASCRCDKSSNSNNDGTDSATDSITSDFDPDLAWEIYTA